MQVTHNLDLLTPKSVQHFDFSKKNESISDIVFELPFTATLLIINNTDLQINY